MNPHRRVKLFVADIRYPAQHRQARFDLYAARTPVLRAVAMPLGAIDKEILLNDVGSLPTFGTVRIEDELITYASVSGNTLLGVVRGDCGTTPAAHPAASAVSAVPAGCAPTPSPTSTGEPGACVGDCNHNGTVTVDELVLGVNIALGTGSVTTCSELDANASGTVTVDELVRGVAIALGNATPDSCRAFDRNGDGWVTLDELVRGVNAAFTGAGTLSG